MAPAVDEKVNAAADDGGAPFLKIEPPMVLGEAPIYRAADSTLHWVDCVRDPCEFHIANLNEDCTKVLQHRRLKLEESVTVHFFRRDDPDSYIVAYYAGVAFLSAKTGQLTILREIIPPSSRPVLRFNDGAVDSKGRFWLAEIDLVGMRYGANRCPKEHGRPKGSLWRYDPDGQLHLMLEGGLICGNGLAWSPDDKTMYLNDSCAGLVYAFDYDAESGAIGRQRVFLDFRLDEGVSGEPDGMVTDVDGRLWIAVWASHCVMAFSPAGQHLRSIQFPAKNMSCTTFGGPANDVLFVTSAIDRSDKRSEDDQGGHVYRYHLGIRGTVKNVFAG